MGPVLHIDGIPGRFVGTPVRCPTLHAAIAAIAAAQHGVVPLGQMRAAGLGARRPAPPRGLDRADVAEVDGIPARPTPFGSRRAFVVELDGAAVHRTRRAFHADRRRDAALAAAGYVVVRRTCERGTREQDGVAAELREILALRAGLYPSARPYWRS